MAEDLVERQRRGEKRGWYRVPSGLNSSDCRVFTVAHAVDDEEWQRVRGLGLRGQPTDKKLHLLEVYLELELAKDDGLTHFLVHGDHTHTWTRAERAALRVENYMGALVRGGLVQREEDGTWTSKR